MLKNRWFLKEYFYIYSLSENREVYTIFVLIESYIYQNQLEKAAQHLNKIKTRVGVSEVPANLSQEQLLDELLKESRKEFFCENGYRFFDLKRNNKLSIIKQTKQNWNNKHQLFPIPESEILLNANLLPQNNEY